MLELKMKILITGENGYISNELTSELKIKQEEFEIVKKSIRHNSINEIDLSDIDVVIHPAAIVHKKESLFSEEQYFQVNTALTQALATQAKKAGVSQFIFVSTMAVYGKQEGAIHANTEIKPVTLYGKSKLAAEEALKALEDDHFKVAIIRPPMVYGPRCPGNYQLLSKVSKKTFIFPKIENARSMIFIYNLTEFIYQLIVNKDAGIFHPQDPTYIKTNEMVSEIAKNNKRKIIFSSLIGRLLKGFIGGKSLYKKVFGNLYYEQDLSVYRDNSYQKYDIKQAITITEKD